MSDITSLFDEKNRRFSEPVTRTFRVDGRTAHELEVYSWGVDASELGIRVGEKWPIAIETPLGNGQPFRFHDSMWEDGDLLYVEYRQAFGCLKLRVFND
jgi:hypothetical protein